MGKIRQTLNDLKIQGKKAFIPYLTFGYPDVATFEKTLLALDSLEGVSIIEVGLPFSDPVADGPVIQQSSAAALANGVNLQQYCSVLKKIKPGLKSPLILMTYYNLVFGAGMAHFMDLISGIIDGLIIPDILPEDAVELRKEAAAGNIDMTFFLSPTSAPERIKLVDRASTGFVYYVSVTGTTGARESFSDTVYSQIKKTYSKLNSPLCAGFGISTAEHVNKFNSVSDGVIVGSAFIRRMVQCDNKSKIPHQIREYAQCLIKG